MIQSKTNLLSAGILDRFLVFGFKLIGSLISPSLVVDTKLIQYLFQELLQREGTANCSENFDNILYNTKSKNKYDEHWQQK